MAKPRIISIYLPQFYPFKENDEWWGKGFTEWTNVTSAKPLFKGHYQPQLPSDLGFYDLRLPETRQAQVDLAKAYNVDGFCYYHYWFHGKRLLNEPIDEVLKSQKPDFPFCYFWANETWSRRWEGNESHVLMDQKYSFEDDKAHAEWLIESFKDERYMKINNRPIFLIYKPFDLPDPKKTFKIFEDVCKSHGIEKPYFVASNSHNTGHNPYELGFDMALHFEARQYLLSQFMVNGPTLKKFVRNLLQGIVNPSLKVYNYKQYKERAKKHKIKYKGFPCVLVGFDNTARKGKNAVVLRNQNIKDFKTSLIDAKKDVENFPEEEKIVFVNAWNEWAEGNHLEPCQKWGTKFLEAIKEVFN